MNQEYTPDKQKSFPLLKLHSEDKKEPNEDTNNTQRLNYPGLKEKEKTRDSQHNLRLYGA